MIFGFQSWLSWLDRLHLYALEVQIIFLVRDTGAVPKESVSTFSYLPISSTLQHGHESEWGFPNRPVAMGKIFLADSFHKIQGILCTGSIIKSRFKQFIGRQD